MKRLLLCAALFASTAFADVDPALFGDLHWRLIGPFRGGRVLAVTGVPNEPDHFYFGHVNGGVWESHDAGRTWTPIFDDQPVGSIGALAVAPSDAKTIYAGTGEADMRSDISFGDGVYWLVQSGGAPYRVYCDMIDDGGSDVTCQFCGRKYAFTRADLMTLTAKHDS